MEEDGGRKEYALETGELLGGNTKGPEGLAGGLVANEERHLGVSRGIKFD